MPIMMYKGIPYGEGTNTLDSLKDVNISNPSDGDVLKYDSSTGKFENGQLSFGGHDYSLTEQVVGAWIDGSTLYEKTVSETITSSSAQVIVTIAGAEYKKIEGFIKTDKGGVVPVPFNDGSSFYVPYTDGDDVLLAKRTASQGDGNTIVLIIQYTKSST